MEEVATGWNNGLCQDYNRALGRWFADRLGAKEQLRRDMMATIFKRETRYIVVKLADLHDCGVHHQAVKELDEVLHKIQALTPKRTYLVLESDWPEYELAFNALEARLTGKQQPDQFITQELASAMSEQAEAYTEQLLQDKGEFHPDHNEVHDTYLANMAIGYFLRSLPKESSTEARTQMHLALQESNWPANPQSVAKAGWRALRQYLNAYKILPGFHGEKVVPTQWKDNDTAQLVNSLTDVAVEFGQTQQLRERIAQLIRPAVAKLQGQ